MIRDFSHAVQRALTVSGVLLIYSVGGVTAVELFKIGHVFVPTFIAVFSVCRLERTVRFLLFRENTMADKPKFSWSTIFYAAFVIGILSVYMFGALQVFELLKSGYVIPGVALGIVGLVLGYITTLGVVYPYFYDRGLKPGEGLWPALKRLVKTLR